MKLKIKVTKEILKKSMWCGTEKCQQWTTQSCAIALAVRDIFPNAHVGGTYIAITHFDKISIINLPYKATRFIKTFDFLKNLPKMRLQLPEFDFEIEIPEGLINEINIDDILKSETLELVS